MKIKTKYKVDSFISGLTQKQNNMKRYECQFDDGQYICSFNQLKDARKYRSENNFRYISRWIKIFDSKKGVYLN